MISIKEVFNKIGARWKHHNNNIYGGHSSHVVICCALRTPITRAKKGGLAPAYPDDLLLPLFEAVVARTQIDPKEIQDVCVGNCLQPGSGATSSRIAQLLSCVPYSTALYTVNRQCSSGLQAIANVAAQIHAGYIDIGMAGGVESMTHFDMPSALSPNKLGEAAFRTGLPSDCLIPMGIVSENVAEKFGVSRTAQDELAVKSHSKAAAAQANGLFDNEIIPVTVGGRVISKDDGIREGTSMERLAELKSPFKTGGTTTAGNIGNSSQISDGAALCLLARRSTAERLKLPILGRLVAFSAAGVPPRINGIGPVVAIPSVLRQAGLSIDDIDIFEINEAFASQASYCVQSLNIPNHKFNPKGGAIALGHPLGATGARQLATLLPELKRIGGRYGVISMCNAGGMGAAAVIENLQ